MTSDNTATLTDHIAKALDFWRIEVNPDVTVGEILAALETMRYKLTEGSLTFLR